MAELVPDMRLPVQRPTPELPLPHLLPSTAPMRPGWWIMPFAVLGLGAWIGLTLLVRWLLAR